MILFLTSSLSISTEVPCAWAAPPLGSPADATESECNDWTSHSRDMGAVEVGVPAAKDAVDGVGAVCCDEEAAEATDLKEVRRFWAEDLRRIEGRWPSLGDMDMITELKAIAEARSLPHRKGTAPSQQGPRLSAISANKHGVLVPLAPHVNDSYTR